jgi:hypothetical protein
VKLSLTLAIPGLAALLTGPAFAQAKPQQPENTPQACSDGVDNDGDGWVDCADQDCQRLPQCQPQAQPNQAPNPPPPAPPNPAPPPNVAPPPQYPPPSQYQYPPPPQFTPPPSYQQPYMQPPVSYEPQPPFGLVTGIIGSTLLVAGFGMLMGSIDPWLAANCVASTPTNPNSGHCADNDLRNTGIVLDSLGGVFFAVGVIMAPIGWYQFGKYRRWKRSHQTALAPTPNGLGFTF